MRNIKIASLLFLLLPSTAFAFVTLKDYGGNDIYWNKSSINWYIHPNGSADVPLADLTASITDGMNSWDTLSCFTKTIVYGGTKSSDPQNGVYIRFVETNWDDTVEGAAAYAQTWKQWGGVITNGVIVFNGQDIKWSIDGSENWFVTTSDVQAVLTHEMGHILGLDHTRYRDATMFFSGGEIDMRSLEQDDKDGLCYIYGSFSSGKPCDTCEDDNDCASGYCLQYSDNYHYCGKDCSNDSQCGDTFYCYDMGSGYTDQCAAVNGYCNQYGSNIQMGDYCYGHETCTSGLCLAVPGDAYCSKTCSSDSQCSGLNCKNGYCLKPGTKALGQQCAIMFECVSNICLGDGSGSLVCTQECDTSANCPNDYGCVAGYCFKAGSGGYGSTCAEHLDCASANCATVGPSEKICTTVCTSSSQCPSGDPCVNKVCVPNGNKPFGMKCSSSSECDSGLCTKIGATSFCSNPCETDAQCPQGSACTSNKVCYLSSEVTFCLSKPDCKYGEFCKPVAGKAYGQCIDSCNPLSDTGCLEGYSCQWFWDSSALEIKGECVEDAGGGKNEDEECGLTGPSCRPFLYCTAIDKGFRCYRDCDITSGLGCGKDETCVSLNISSDPNHGVCYCNIDDCAKPTFPDPDPTEDTGSTFPDVVTQPDQSDNSDLYPQDDTTTPIPEDSASSDPDNKQPDNSTPTDPSSKGGTCSTAPSNSSSSAVVLLMLLMVIMVVAGVRKWERE